MNLDRFGPAMKAVVSVLIILAFFGIISALLVLTYREKDFPPGIKETLLVLVGVLAGEFKNVCGYWLGTSHSSSRKTELLAGETK
jgi:hypothetical protein